MIVSTLDLLYCLFTFIWF